MNAPIPQTGLIVMGMGVIGTVGTHGLAITMMGGLGSQMTTAVPVIHFMLNSGAKSQFS